MAHLVAERSAAAIVALADAPDGLGLADVGQVLGIPLSSAQRALASLEAAGVVRREGATRRRYRLEPDVPVDALRTLAEWVLGPNEAGRIRASRARLDLARTLRATSRAAVPADLSALPLTPAAAEALPILLRRLVERFRPLQVILFGSQAHGDARPDSDIDLLIVMPVGTGKYETRVAMYGALRGIRIGTDLVVTTPSDLDNYGHLVGTVLRDALTEGVTIYDRRSADHPDQAVAAVGAG